MTQNPNFNPTIELERNNFSTDINDTNFGDKYSVFKKSSNSKESNNEKENVHLEKLTDIQIERIILIIELYQGVKLSKVEIQKATKSVSTKTWLSSEDTSKLGIPKMFSIGNAVWQTAGTYPAAFAMLVRGGYAANPTTSAAAMLGTLGFYAGTSLFVDKKSKEALSGSNKEKATQALNTLLISLGAWGFSNFASYSGGMFFDSVNNNPEQKIQEMIVSKENIKELKDKFQTRIDDNRNDLKNNAEFNKNLAILAEKQKKVEEIKLEIQRLEAAKITAISTESKEQIKARESEISVKRGSINDTYLNSKGEKINSPLPAEIKALNDRQIEIENGINIANDNGDTKSVTRTNLIESKQIKADLDRLVNNSSKAFKTTEELDIDGSKVIPYEVNKTVLRLLAQNRNINPEHLDDLVIKHKLSSEELDLIASDPKKNMAFVLAWLAIMAVPETVYVLGSAKKRQQNRLILDKDYQRGFESLGQKYTSDLARLRFSDVNTGKKLSDKVDIADQELKVSYEMKDSILNQIKNSPEFLVAMQIVAAEQMGSLGQSMKFFREEFIAQNPIESPILNGIGSRIGSVFNVTGDLLGKVSNTLGSSLAELKENKATKIVENIESDLVKYFKTCVRKAVISKDPKSLLIELNNAVAIMNNDSNIEFSSQFLSQEMNPIQSIITLSSEIAKFELKKDLHLKTLQELVRNSATNKGVIYTIDNLIETISLPTSLLNKKEISIIDDKIKNPSEIAKEAIRTKTDELFKIVEDELTEMLIKTNDSNNLDGLDLKYNYFTNGIERLIKLTKSANLDSVKIVKATIENLYAVQGLELDTVYTDSKSYTDTIHELLKELIKGIRTGQFNFIENNDFFKSIQIKSIEFETERRESLSNWLVNNETLDLSNKEQPSENDPWK